MEEHGMYFGKNEFYQINRKPNHFRQRITDVKNYLIAELKEENDASKTEDVVG